jgi:hypothetical protein
MGDRITINFTANTREVERGAGRISDSLGDVENALDDVGANGERSLEKAINATDDLGESASDTGGKIGGLGSIAKDALEGDLTGAAETAADSLSLLGPVGVAAGIAAVAGLEVVKGVVEGIGDATEADQQRVAEWAQSYIDAGSTILGAAESTARALEIITDPEKFKEAQQASEDWGVTTATAIAALSGQEWAIEAVTSSVAGMNDELEVYKNSKTAPTSEEQAAFVDLSYKYDAATAKLAKLNGEMGEGKKQADVYSQYLRELAENTANATSKVDEFGDSVYSLPDGTVVYIDAETGQATADTDAIANKIYGLQDKTVVVTLDTADAQAQLLALFANPYTAKVKFPSSPTYGVKVP